MKYELENRLAIRRRHRRGRMDTDVQGKCKLSFPFWTIVTHVRSIHAWIRTRPVALSKNESCRNTKLNMTKLDKSNSREGKWGSRSSETGTRGAGCLGLCTCFIISKLLEGSKSLTKPAQLMEMIWGSGEEGASCALLSGFQNGPTCTTKCNHASI